MTLLLPGRAGGFDPESWIARGAERALVQIDRAYIEHMGLHGFVQLGWGTVQPEATFRDNWHIAAICEHLEAVSSGDILRLLITMPPRHMKSLTASVFWPAYDWIMHPERRFLYASYSQDLSFRDSKQCRNVIRSPWYQARWGDRFRIRGDDNQVSMFSNDKTGYRMATSVDAKATGFGGSIVCFPHDQLILTERGPVRIGDLVAARERLLVWAYDTLSGRVALKPVTGWHRNPGRLIVSVTLSDGSSFCCTADHWVWTNGGWVAAGLLGPSDRIPNPRLSDLHDALGADPLGAKDRAPLLIEAVGHAPVTYCLSVGDYHTMMLPGNIVVSNCVDDPHNNRNAESEPIRTRTLSWWDETMSSRLDDPKTGAFVIIQQRVHHQDLAGHVMEKQSRIPYVHLCLPARYDPEHKYVWIRDPRTLPGELLWPQHVPEDALAELEQNLGPYAAAAQLQQTPTPREGGLIKRTWFELADTIEPDTTNLSRGWDLAASARKQIKADPDYTAGVKIGFSAKRGKYIILDVRRDRLGPGKVRQWVLETADADGKRCKVTIPKDPGQAGVDQAQQMVLMLSAFEVLAEPPSGDKATRAAGLAGQAEIGNVEILKAPWNEMFLTEMASFPLGGHDDMVDAAATAYNRVRDSTTGIIDWARDLEQRQRAAQAEQEERERRILAGEAPAPPGMRMTETTTTDFGFSSRRTPV